MPKQIKSQQTALSLEDEACRVIELGGTEVPVFTPQPLMSFCGVYLAYKTKDAVCLDVNQVALLRLINPLSQKPITTVFAIKEKEGYIWSRVATSKVYFSSDNAFIYEKVDIYDIPLCKSKEKKSIIAHCHYNKGDITVLSLLIEKEKIKDFEIPCELDEAMKLAELL